MSFAPFNQAYNNERAVGLESRIHSSKPKQLLHSEQTGLFDNIQKSYRDKTNHFKNGVKNKVNDRGPSFMMYDEDDATNRMQGPNDNAVLATKGILCEDELDPVTTLFFSRENMERIQRMLRVEISRRTNGEYRLDDNQDESDLLIAMRAVLFDMYGARFLPFKIKRQVKELNFQVVQYVVPDMLEAMKQQYGYLKEINEPLKPMLRPINVNHAGRKTLPSISTLFGA